MENFDQWIKELSKGMPTQQGEGEKIVMSTLNDMMEGDVEEE